MIIRYFKSGFTGQYITIGVIGLLIWSVAAINPPVMPAPNGPVPLYSLLYQWFSTLPYLAMLLGFLIVFFEAIWLNKIYSKHDLIRHNTSFAALLFLLFISCFPPFLTLTPINIIIPLLLYILNALFKAYHEVEPVELVYSAGFFISLASFFYLPAILLYGFLLICFLLYRSMKWREWVSSLIGLATPFIFLIVVYFLIDQLPALMEMYSDYLSQLIFSFHDIQAVSLPYFIMIGLVGLFALLGFWDTVKHMSEKTVELRKKTIVLQWLFFWIVITMGFSGNFQLYHIGLISICLALFVTNFYLNLKKSFLFQLLLWLFILAIFVNTALFVTQ